MIVLVFVIIGSLLINAWLLMTVPFVDVIDGATTSVTVTVPLVGYSRPIVAVISRLLAVMLPWLTLYVIKSVEAGTVSVTTISST